MRRIPLAAAAGALLLALGVQAAPDTAERSFESFCAQWMSKLDDRERHNLASAEINKDGNGFFVEYVGYAEKPVRCEASRVGSARTVVGKLVYHELRVRRTAPTRAAARRSAPRVLHEIEVLEIFRHDGSRWVY